PVLEDAAEALGSTYKNQKGGTLADISILSFNGNKIITTSGGGALVTHDPKIKEKAVFYATQSRDEAQHHQHSKIGINYRMSNIVAGIGRGQMEVLDNRVEARRKMNAFYQELFQNIPGIKIHTEPSADYYSNHWLSAIIIDPEKAGKSREELRLFLLERNIESRPLCKPMHLQPFFKDASYYGGSVAEELFQKGSCLPYGPNF